ncbi:ubiquitin-specific protease doa4 [Parahypoxylon ruwenzoriense]
MSSVAFTRPTIAPGVDAQGTMASGMNSDSRVVANGSAERSAGGGSGKGRAPYRHIDDLVSVGVDVDLHIPLPTLLQLGDIHMKQATTYNDFRRPDLALQEYIKAFTIAVEKVPRHKDYPSMKLDRGDLNRRYNALKLKITTNGATFDKIKEEIKEDNKRSGVRPATTSKTSAELVLLNRPSAGMPSQHKANGSIDLQVNRIGNSIDVSGEGSTTHNAPNTDVKHKVKPVVQPKPQALHGKAIGQTSKDHSGDLADRFARLRDPQKPENSARANEGARSMGISTLHQRLSSIDSSMPAMPKLPDAIYSPARGTVTSEVANLPSSTPRGMFSRTNSVTSTPSVSARMSTENAIRAFSGEQFVAAHAYGAPPSSATSTRLRIPGGDTITAKTLADLINHKSSKVEILIIDVRNRESFDEGHIKSDGTICVEPEILMRENVSADEIADSMVLAPSNERLAIEQRDKVDLVVIYDQDSMYIPTRVTGDSSEMVLYNMRQALSYYSYSRPLKSTPKLLRGGINSWIEEFGESSLETTNTLPDSTLRNGGGTRSRAKTRTLNQDEISRFEETIEEDRTGASTFDYIKTREDFVRRYPSVTGAPESMTAPVKKGPHKSGRGFEAEEEDFLIGIAPAPPRRPAPAIPRTRYSGLESRDDDSNAGAIAMQASVTSSISQPRTGLLNPQNWCYANSTIQVLLSSAGFIDEMLRPDWPNLWRASLERRPNQPQLMAKILGNLLQWMNRKQFEVMRATTLMHYMRSIHTGYVPVGGGNTLIRLGDDHQHDAEEFTNFIFDQLAAETDLSSNLILIPPPVPPSGSDRLAAYIVQSWWNVLSTHFSMIDRYWRVLEVNERRCVNCGQVGYFPENTHGTFVTPPTSRDRVDLETLLANQQWTQAETIEIRCEKCQHPEQVRRTRLARLPPLYRVVIRRHTGGRDDWKQINPVQFPVDNFDLKKYTWSENSRSEAAIALGDHYNEGILSPTTYDLYGIQCHVGEHTQAGHYWSYVRAEGNEWFRCEDHSVRAMRDRVWLRELENLFNCANSVTPVQLFYKRKDIPWSWDH